MASPFERRSAIRKFVYFGLILGLFTVSLMHRKFIINTQAERLLLREVGKGKADLTDAALRLTLSGARGVAITWLWLSAIEKQKRHEWNELEAAVDSLTRLQPRFISPWVYQGWNLAFNVSVECDRVRDKYYYITRGIKLLCRGEEKNDPGQATPPHDWPASPELRFEIANAYHRKIGQGDESKTIRCLFDLSCIPLSERMGESFYISGPQGKQLDLDKFKVFCETNPRFVRRLRERLTGFERPEAIVQFLIDSRDIPGRIENRNNLGPDKRLEEFPILPPQDHRASHPYHDWRTSALATNLEDFDIYVCVRAWHTFAQIPLPPPNKDYGAVEETLNRLKYRLPKFTTVIFRYSPARMQAFVAEELQKDGWFDDDGWRITGWFDSLTRKPVIVVGTGARFDSSRAWDQAFEWWRTYGLENGMYLEPEDMRKLERDALEQGSQSFAARKLIGNYKNRERTRFDVFIRQAKVERAPEAVAARKAIFEVQQQAKAGNPNVYLSYQTRVLPLWLDLLMRYPEFRHLEDIQEESFRLQAEYLWEYQKANRDWLAPLVKDALCIVPTWPLPGLMPPPPVSPEGTFAPTWPLGILRYAVQKETIKVLPIRTLEGPFDQVFLLEGREVEALKPIAMAMARQALWPPIPTDPQTPDFAFSRFVVWPPLRDGATPEIGIGLQTPWPPNKEFLSTNAVGAVAGSNTAAAWPRPVFMMLSSAEQRLITTRRASPRDPPQGPGWIPLIPWEVAHRTRANIIWMQRPGQ